MIVLYPIIIALICCLVLWLTTKDRLKYKLLPVHYLMLCLTSVVVPVVTYFIMLSFNISSTEYLGYYVTSIKHYDSWDEWIEETCTREVPSGVDADGNTTYTTETYDCSYCKNHPEEWYYIDNTGDQWEITEDTYKILKERWGTPEIFIDMHRRYYTKDGDAQEHKWNGNKKDAVTLTVSHTYKNKIKGSKSLFGFTEISKYEAEKLELFNYPEQKRIGKYLATDQNPILGVSVHDTIASKFKFINGYYGKSHQFRLYILFFKGKSLDIVQSQRDYWLGGNKNELILCFGLDSTDNKLLWTDAFSWCDRPEIEISIRQYYSGKDSVDLNELSYVMEKYLKDGLWKRKEFKDYEYLNVELNGRQISWLIIITLLFNVGISFLFINISQEGT